jgi:hypothetical protein
MSWIASIVSSMCAKFVRSSKPCLGKSGSRSRSRSRKAARWVYRGLKTERTGTGEVVSVIIDIE